MLCLWSAKGGVGCSVMAAALALLRADEGPVVLVDIGGDLQWVLGVAGNPGSGPAGIVQWLGADNPPPQSLARLEIPVIDGLSLLPWSAPPGHGPGPPSSAEHSWPEDRVELLARLLAAEARTVIVDVGLRTHPDLAVHRHLLGLASRSLLVTRACYLALRSARRWDRPDAVIVIDEVGRPLGHRDISNAVDAPIESSIRWDPAVARSVDAGLLTARLPRALRPLKAVAG